MCTIKNSMDTIKNKYFAIKFIKSIIKDSKLLLNI